jgi:ataxia telangiectasia mutated family protein
MCIGSKGGRYKQLVKGEDDLRQDAIMEQVSKLSMNYYKMKVQVVLIPPGLSVD